jgi:cyclopropane fatty-acyl-phospholipid synthase-like methyltransferase
MMKNMADFLQRYASMLAEGGVMIARVCCSTSDEKKFAGRVEAVVARISMSWNATTPNGHPSFC